MREQTMITGDWRSNWPGERAVPLAGSDEWRGAYMPQEHGIGWLPVNRPALDARLESDLLAAGLRTRYCTDGDCLNRLTAPGAQTLCDGHRVIVYDPSKAPPMPGDDGADAAGLFHDSPHKDVGNGRAAKVVRRNDRSAVTLACGGVARSGDRVVTLDDWCRDPGTVMTVYDGHPPGDVTLYVLNNGGAEHFALLRDASETPVVGEGIKYRHKHIEDWFAGKWRGAPGRGWSSSAVEWFYTTPPF